MLLDRREVPGSVHLSGIVAIGFPNTAGVILATNLTVCGILVCDVHVLKTVFMLQLKQTAQKKNSESHFMSWSPPIVWFVVSFSITEYCLCKPLFGNIWFEREKDSVLCWYWLVHATLKVQFRQLCLKQLNEVKGLKFSVMVFFKTALS